MTIIHLLKILFCILISIWQIPSFAQSPKFKFDCHDLSSILESPQSVKHFNWLAKQNDTLTIVDTLLVFDCNNPVNLQRPARIISHYPNELFYGAESFHLLKTQKYNYLVLVRFTETKKGVILHFWQANDNAFMDFLVTKKRKLKVKVTGYGVY